jgi:hypothetical protein
MRENQRIALVHGFRMARRNLTQNVAGAFAMLAMLVSLNRFQRPLHMANVPRTFSRISRDQSSSRSLVSLKTN